VDLVAFFILLTFRVDTSSFVAGALVTTLAFFVAFSELIKLFFSIVINHSSKFGLRINDDEKEGAVI
jgi:small-conductance mechanosensitive channel